jgi:ribosomal protein S18 acetylase RimI-like enzyme
MSGAGETELRVRRYETQDADRVWQLHQRAIAKMPAHENDGFWGDLRDVAGHYAARGGEFWVGLLGGETVAMGGFSPLPPYAVEIKRMRVHPDYQRRGFGRIILQALEAAAIERGYRQASLETTVVQISALALYRTSGYEEVERTIKMGFEVMRMRKELIHNLHDTGLQGRVESN